MNNSSILDQTILPTIAAATRHAAYLFERAALRRQVAQLAADAQPDEAVGEDRGYLGSTLAWLLGSRIGSDDSPDVSSETNSSDADDKKSETNPDADTKSEASSSSESISSSQEQANATLDEFDERLMPTIRTIILARDRAQRAGLPIPPAWRRLRRPADMPLPADLADLDMPANLIQPGDAPGRPDEPVVPIVR